MKSWRSNGIWGLLGCAAALGGCSDGAEQELGRTHDPLTADTTVSDGSLACGTATSTPGEAEAAR
jgi:hypothetical protein